MLALVIEELYGSTVHVLFFFFNDMARPGIYTLLFVASVRYVYKTAHTHTRAHTHAGTHPRTPTHTHRHDRTHLSLIHIPEPTRPL